MENPSLDKNSLFVAGQRATVLGVTAICEAFALEHFALTYSLLDIAGNIASTEEKTNVMPILRQVIQQYFAANQNINDNSSPSSSSSSSSFLPPLPPIAELNKTASEIEKEVVLKLTEEWDREERRQADEARRLIEEEDRKAAELLSRSFNEEDEKSQLFFCPLCLGDEPVNGSYSLDCAHRFCEACLSGYICSKINSHEVSENVMICPSEGCEIPISHEVVRGCTKDLHHDKEYEKYLEYKNDTFFADEMKKGCLIRCPTEHCNFVFYYSVQSLRPLSFQCETCHESYCINCKVLQMDTSMTSSTSTSGRYLYGPGHQPHSCAEQIQILQKNAESKRRFEEWKVLNESSQRLFEEAIKANGWKRCPSCSFFIERNEGCDHMTCRNCKCSFCYVCGKYDRANPTNRGDCGSSCPNRR